MLSTVFLEICVCFCRSSSYNSNWKKSSDISTDNSERQRTESFNEVTSDSQVIALRFNTKLERNINRGCILGEYYLNAS